MKRRRRWLIAAVLLAVLFSCVMMLRQADERARDAQLQVFREAYPTLAALPDFVRVSGKATGEFLLHLPDGSAMPAQLPEGIAAMLRQTRWLIDRHGLLGLRKCGDDIFFITGGGADDEIGFVLSADDEVNTAFVRELTWVQGRTYAFVMK